MGKQTKKPRHQIQVLRDFFFFKNLLRESVWNMLGRLTFFKKISCSIRKKEALLCAPPHPPHLPPPHQMHGKCEASDLDNKCKWIHGRLVYTRLRALRTARAILGISWYPLTLSLATYSFYLFPPVSCLWVCLPGL